MKNYKHVTLQNEIAEINSLLASFSQVNHEKGNKVFYYTIGKYYYARKQLKRQYRALLKPEDFTKVNSDSNGTPHYVCHYVKLLTRQEKELHYPDDYPRALKNARQFGGGKFHNKQYGGGIVFQSYNLDDLSSAINNFIEIKEKN